MLIALAGLMLPACGARTPLIDPVDLTGGAGRRVTTGSAGTTGHAGASGSAGTTGFAGTPGTAGSSGTGGTTAECSDGMSRCSGASAVQLCQNGAWSAPSQCSMMCISGVCAECVPGAQECAGPAALRTCSSQGLWPEPVMCPGAAAICVGAACSNVDGGVPAGDCMEGTTECQDMGTVRLCQGGKWTVFFACEHGCVSGVCAECKAGDTRCGGAQKCSDMGIWVGDFGASCPDG